VYLDRPTRETAFLCELLKEFKGVLVSDFYNGYDSLPCEQQKCLIHLIRDTNNADFPSSWWLGVGGPQMSQCCKPRCRAVNTFVGYSLPILGLVGEVPAPTGRPTFPGIGVIGVKSWQETRTALMIRWA
jgi:hypothetical protein